MYVFVVLKHIPHILHPSKKCEISYLYTIIYSNPSNYTSLILVSDHEKVKPISGQKSLNQQIGSVRLVRSCIDLFCEVPLTITTTIRHGFASYQNVQYIVLSQPLSKMWKKRSKEEMAVPSDFEVNTSY